MSEEALMISIKNGDIKCDVGEVRFLLYIVEQMNQLINKYAVGEDKTEREKIKKFIEYYEYFKDKYLVLQEVRNQENFYFNQMKAWQKKLNESSDENILKIEGNVVEAVGVGKASLYIKAGNKETVFDYNIQAKIAKISIPSTIKIAQNETKKLNPKIITEPKGLKHGKIKCIDEM